MKNSIKMAIITALIAINSPYVIAMDASTTPLMEAIHKSDCAIAQDLLIKGANPNEAAATVGTRGNAINDTPIKAAVRITDDNLRMKMLRLLKKYGANPFQVADGNKCALQVAVDRRDAASMLEFIRDINQTPQFAEWSKTLDYPTRNTIFKQMTGAALATSNLYLYHRVINFALDPDNHYPRLSEKAPQDAVTQFWSSYKNYDFARTHILPELISKLVPYATTLDDIEYLKDLYTQRTTNVERVWEKEKAIMPWAMRGTYLHPLPACQETEAILAAKEKELLAATEENKA